MSTPYLPHGLMRLVDVVGFDKALTIALALGGGRLRIPKKPEGSELARIVGIDAATKIAEHEGLKGDRLDIPTARKILSDWLRETYGWSQERRAIMLKVSRRTVQHWDHGTMPRGQYDLFNPVT